VKKLLNVPAILLLPVLLLLPSLALSQQEKAKKVVILPLKMVVKGDPDTFSNELAGVLGSDLEREGDVQVMSGRAFLDAVKERTADPGRIARIAERAQAQFAIWGSVTKLDDGYALELSVMEADPRKKPRLFSATGKDMEDLLKRIQDLSVEIGAAVLKRPMIGQIKIEGNRRIQRDAILNKLDMKAGAPFRRSGIGDEIREIYSMGYFDDVQIRAEEAAPGTVDLHIVLKERPSLRTLEIQGNKLFSKDEILDTLITKSFSVANLEKIRDDIEKIRKMYEKSGYYQPKIEYEIKELSRNEATLIFKIDEGRKSFLTDIELEGRKKVADKDLRQALSVKPKSWIWFLDESGTFTREKLEENRMRLMQYYLDQGFISVQIGEPKMEITDGRVKVTYPIREGSRFQVRKVDVEGDLIAPKEQLIAMLQTKPRTWFKRSLVADDIKDLIRLYNNMGYAYADVEPIQRVNDKYDFIDLSYRLHKGDRVTIERVDIVGNERTRDKVIRRHISISEGDLYSADRLESTKSAIEGMDFFEAVKLKTSPGSRADTVNVTVEVMEKKTGSLTAGFGYSSQEGAMANVDLKERNLWGLGIVGNAKGNLSGRRNSYEGSLSYPWVFDLPLTSTLRAYKAQQKETFYLRDSDGYSVHLNYPIYGLWQMETGFARDSSKLSGIEQMFARSVVDYYRPWGKNPKFYSNLSENSLSVRFLRDTRNNGMLPSAGARMLFGGRFSGFGADVAFSSYNAEATYYKRVFGLATMKFRTIGWLLAETGHDPIPMDRRVILGGIQSLRGYQHGQIGPKDRYGNIIGGDRGLVSTVECLFPVIPAMKLFGVAFADVGNAWNVSDSPFLQEVKAGAGLGIRWVSPMGPLRVEYGWKVTPQRGEDPGALGFSMGQLF